MSRIIEQKALFGSKGGLGSRPAGCLMQLGSAPLTAEELAKVTPGKTEPKGRSRTACDLMSLWIKYIYIYIY